MERLLGLNSDGEREMVEARNDDAAAAERGAGAGSW